MDIMLILVYTARQSGLHANFGVYSIQLGKTDIMLILVYTARQSGSHANIGVYS